MALTRITKGVIKPNENYDTNNINSTGIVTAIGLDINGNGDISGNLSVGGVLTYEDVTSIDSVGIITARDGIDCNGDLDVDGHTNLDNVSVAGVTTFSDDVYFDGATANRDIVFDRSANTLHVKDNAILKIGESRGTTFSNNGTNTQITHSPIGSFYVAANTFQVFGSGTRSGNTYDNTLLRLNNGVAELGHEIPNGGASGFKLATSAKGITVGTGVTIETNGQATFAGVSTFSGAIDLNADLDVDGHTNLDNVSVAGVTTITGSGTALQVGGGTNPHSTKPTVNIAPSSGNAILTLRGESPTLFFDKTGSGHGKIITDGVNFSIYNGAIDNLNTEVVRIAGSGNVSVYKDLDVDGHTNLDNVSVAGVSTFSGNITGASGVDLNLDSSLNSNSSTAFSGFNGRLVFDTTYSDTARGPNKIQLQHVGNWISGFGISSDTLDIYTGGTTRFSKSTNPNSYTTQLTIDGYGNLSPSGDVILTSSTGHNSSTAVTDAAWSRLEFDDDFSDTARGPNKILLTNYSNWKAGFGISSNSLDVYTGGVLRFYGKTNTDDASNKETLAKFTTDGAAELYHNNEAKILTELNGATVQDLTATGAYLSITSSSGNNGKVYGVSGTTIGFLDSQNHWLIKGIKDGSVQLYHDNSPILSTTATGIEVTGEVAASQDYPNSRPTLDFNFAATKKLDPRITYSRTGPASFVNEFGKVVLVGDNTPRFDHDPITRESKGLLIEHQRTNYAQYSTKINNDQGNYYNLINNAVLVSDAGVAPDGTNTATKMYPASSGNARGIEDIYALPSTGEYTTSVYVKAAGHTGWIALYSIDGGTRAYFNPTTGAAGQPGTYSGTPPAGKYGIEDAGNGWYRIHLTVNLSSTGGNEYFYIYFGDSDGSTSVTHSGTNGILMWGLQVEKGSYPTSYIPTQSDQATRGADFTTLRDDDFTDAISQTEGTLIAEYDNVTNDGYVLSLDGSGGDKIGMVNSNSYQLMGTAGGSSQGTTDNGTLLSGTNRFALAYKVNDTAISINGNTATVDTSYTLPTTTFMSIGHRQSQYDQLGSCIARIMYYNKRLPNSQLKTLSTR